MPVSILLLLDIDTLLAHTPTRRFFEKVTLRLISAFLTVMYWVQRFIIYIEFYMAF